MLLVRNETSQGFSWVWEMLIIVGIAILSFWLFYQKNKLTQVMLWKPEFYIKKAKAAL